MAAAGKRCLVIDKRDTEYGLPCVPGGASCAGGVVLFTGPIDAYFDYRYGAMEYRKVRFETELLDTLNFQGNTVVNYTDRETQYMALLSKVMFSLQPLARTVRFF